MADVSIRPKPNGPYLIEGPPTIAHASLCAAAALLRTSLFVTARTVRSDSRPLK